MRALAAYVLTALSILLTLTPPALCQPSTAPINKIKSAYIYSFLKLTERTEEKPSPISICTNKQSALYPELKTLEQKTILGKALRVAESQDLLSLHNCTIIYIEQNSSYNNHNTLKKLSTLGVLSVGDDPAFNRNGGIIRFFEHEGSLRFEINQAQALKSGLTFHESLIKAGAPLQE